ncbi:filamentous hemagglutinin [Leptolyngbya valderiana BDU 20041]|nr:filamentous hemagglutinin [Leptolyngbya valderiana BDU 20041]
MTFCHSKSNFRRYRTILLVTIVEIGSLGVISSNSAFSQVVPDATLPNPSQVTVDNTTYQIEGGTTAGNNLFHSFENFSVPTGAEAFFNNATTIEQILTRVTGSNISNLDGLIRANGTANLFLLNPNGIVFGPNARLDLGGSFFATTAESLVFDNGLEFSATSPEAQPLLSVNVPVGLQFNGRGGEIRVRGDGHSFTLSSSISPTLQNSPSSGLQVNPGRTLGLVGSGTLLDGATLTANGGRIELGGVGVGVVRAIAPVASESQQWHFDYEGVSRFQDVRLVRQAAVDVSGTSVGSMQIVGDRIGLSGGSIALLQNRGVRKFGEIRVRAASALTIRGTTPDGILSTGFRQETLGAGNAGNIEISSPQLLLLEGGQITSRSFAEGNAGNLNIRAAESISIIGTPPLNPRITSIISSSSFGTGATGNLTVSTGRLNLRNGGILAISTFGTGAGGSILVNATESVEAIGGDPRTLTPSTISASSLGPGNAGSTIVNTARAIVRDGGQIASSALAMGDGGSIAINATEFVEIGGVAPGSIVPSSIDASTTQVDEVLRQVLGLPPVPSGSPGNLEINTPELNIVEGGQVTVRNIGTGRAGSLQINAEAVSLDNGGGITASTRSGEGGNAILNVENSLQLRNGSQITAEAGGIGNGGNLAIAADTIALLEGSSIDANAFEGRGGNIEIATQGLFVSPESRITASSQLGIDGVVAVTQPEIDTSSAFVQLSSNPIDSETQVTSACEAAAENTFVVTGNGGLPPDPTDVLRSQTVWTDTRLTEIQASPPEVDSEGRSPSTELDSSQLPLVEATGWQRRDDGTMELVSIPQHRVGNRWGDRVRCSDR